MGSFSQPFLFCSLAKLQLLRISLSSPSFPPCLSLFLSHTHSDIHTLIAEILSLFHFLFSATHNFLPFFIIKMVQAKPPFPSKLLLLSLLVSTLAIFDNGVQCFQGKKVLSMHKFQWKQGSNSSTCLSQETSE